MNRYLPALTLVPLLLAGCAASRPVGAVALGAGGAVLGHELSDGNPALTAAGAAGGVLLSEGTHWLGRRQSAKAYAAGYDQGRSDATKKLYWHYVRLQREPGPRTTVRLYPVHFPERLLPDGTLVEPTIKHLRIEE